jgi:hypothetical protein
MLDQKRPSFSSDEKTLREMRRERERKREREREVEQMRICEREEYLYSP